MKPRRERAYHCPGCGGELTYSGYYHCRRCVRVVEMRDLVPPEAAGEIRRRAELASGIQGGLFVPAGGSGAAA